MTTQVMLWNVAVLAAAVGLAWAWDMVWPLALLVLTVWPKNTHGTEGDE